MIVGLQPSHDVSGAGAIMDFIPSLTNSIVNASIYSVLMRLKNKIKLY